MREVEGFSKLMDKGITEISNIADNIKEHTDSQEYIASELQDIKCVLQEISNKLSDNIKA